MLFKTPVNELPPPLLTFPLTSLNARLFKDVSLLKPSYRDVDDLQNVATFEPKYRTAVSFLEIEKFRAAYYEFNKIPDSYKDTKNLQKIALEAGLLTIGLMNFENATNQKGGEASVSAHLSDKKIKLNNPFIKLIDDFKSI